MRMLALIGLWAAAAFAQQFDVVSIKPQKWTGAGSVGVIVRGDTLDGEHVSLDDLVMFAYSLRGVQLSGGPAWAARFELTDSDLFQVTAKVSGNPPPPIDRFREMLRPVLAERFKLQIHHVEKDLPVYNLVIAKGGPKLKNLGDPATRFDFNTTGKGRYGIHIEATNMTMQEWIDNQLEGYSSRPIFDKTGLTAKYNFTVEFITENAPPGAETGGEWPSLRTAVEEQLGLKLERATAPFDTIVIDHAERPSEN